jgi:hypothetical protein
VTLLSTLFLRVNKYSDAVLAIVSPTANVHGPIRPCEGALAVFFAVLEFTFISSPVIPGLNSATFNGTETELSFIELIDISKIILAMPLELTIHKFSLVVAAISPLKASLSLFLALVELAYVAGAATIIPGLFTDSMLRIIQPFTCVAHSL